MWLTGSLNGRGWDHVRPLALALLAPVALALARHLRMLDLGDDAAPGWASPRRAVARACCSSASRWRRWPRAAAGPIGFVALVSPQIARRLVRGGGAALLPRAAVGAALLVASDLVARRCSPPPSCQWAWSPRCSARPTCSGCSPGPTDREADDRPSAATVAPPSAARTPSPRWRRVSLAYDDRLVVDDLSLTIPPEAVTVIVGANACGKSTLLRGLARLLAPHGHGAARRPGHPPPAHPGGRHPARHPAPAADRARGHHRRRPRGPRPASAPALVPPVVDRGRGGGRALLATGSADLADRPVDELSGGQRQRVWIALALAQGTDLLLLDEPTTFLDLAHQVEVLDLLADLNDRGPHRRGRAPRPQPRLPLRPPPGGDEGRGDRAPRARPPRSSPRRRSRRCSGWRAT